MKTTITKTVVLRTVTGVRMARTGRQVLVGVFGHTPHLSYAWRHECRALGAEVRQPAMGAAKQQNPMRAADLDPRPSEAGRPLGSVGAAGLSREASFAG
jgi:hypothetical protein